MHIFSRSKKFKQKKKDMIKESRKKSRERRQAKMETPEWKPNYSGTLRNTVSTVKINDGPQVSPFVRPPIETKIERDEYLAREERAKEIIEYRKKTLAPTYNKGAYQPILNKEDAKLIGRS